MKTRFFAIVMLLCLFLSFAPATLPSAAAIGGEPVTAHPNAAVYLAENAERSGGAYLANNHSGYTGSGFAAGYDNNGTAKTAFSVTVEAAGTYYISLRYSAGQVGGWPDDRIVGFTVNSNDQKNVTLTGTDASWNTWNEYICKVDFVTGVNTVSIENLTAADNSDVINIDKISIWKHSENPTTDAIAFESNAAQISVQSTMKPHILKVNSNGVAEGEAPDVSYQSSDESVATVVDGGLIKGVSAGTAVITAKSGAWEAKASLTVIPNPILAADCSATQREVDGSMFGFILTPNYDVPDSRMSLLGPLLNRETIPVQNFQAISDLNGSYYPYEYNIMERHLSAYRRAKATGFQWYAMMGMSPSWAAPSGNPVDSFNNTQLKTEEQLANFKQYVKDVFQFMRDNGAAPDFADLTNEYWTGTQETYRVVWEALREVYPEFIPAVGPGAVGYAGIADYYIGYAVKNDITVEGPAWHEFWTADTYASYTQVQDWYDQIAERQRENPKANGKYIIWEENNAGSQNHTDFTRSMANVVRSGVDYNIKGCMESENWNGMSDLMTANKAQQNTAIRRPLWWVYYAFSQMSGNYVQVTTENEGKNQSFTGAVSVDTEDETVKVILAKNDTDGPAMVQLNNVPFTLGDCSVELYKITDAESCGLAYQGSAKPVVTAKNLSFAIDDAKANDTWFAVVKTQKSKPGFVVPTTPDDGEVTLAKPTLSWSASVGAESYRLTVSKHKDLSKPIIKAEGLTGTTYTVTEDLTIGERYHWSVEAVNQNGVTTVAGNTRYSFLVGESDLVPGQFGPYLPSVGTKNEAIDAEFQWSASYHADSYRLVVSKNSDFSEPVFNKSGIQTLRSTGQFGANSQAYYRLAAAEERLEFDTTYYWMVYAVNEHGERPMNGAAHYFTTRAKGMEPTAFNLVYPENNAADVNGRASLIWEEASNAFFYHLEISDTEDMSNIVLERTHMIYNKYTLEQNALEPGKTYYWRVSAYSKNRAYSTNANNVYCFTIEKVPSAPLLYAEQPGGEDGTVTLWIHQSNAADSYNIYYGTEAGVYTRKISDVKDSEVTVSGLEGGTTYYFALTAVNEAGESSIWNERGVRTNGDGGGWAESSLEGETVSVLLSDQSVASPPAPNRNYAIEQALRLVADENPVPSAEPSRQASPSPEATGLDGVGVQEPKNNALLYVLIAVGLAAAVCVFLVLRNRKPKH